MKAFKIVALLLFLNIFNTVSAQVPPVKYPEEVVIVKVRSSSFRETFSATFTIPDEKKIKGLNKTELNSKFEKIESSAPVLDFLLKDGQYTLFQAMPINGGSGIGNSEGTVGYLYIFKELELSNR